MKRLILQPFIAFFILVFAGNICYSEINIPFNDNWKFRIGDSPEYSSPNFDDSSWRVINVPHDWSIEGRYDRSNPSGPQGGFMPCGIAWYRKTFTLPDSTYDKRIYIRFDGVFMKSQVWINGRMVGEYPNGYNAFQYDITPFIARDNAQNLIAVKVDNSLQPASRWYTGSGIYRNVDLVITGQQHFTHDGIFVTTPMVTEDKATVAIKANIICNAYPETRFNWTDNTDLYVWTRNTGSKDTKGGNRRISKNCTVEFTLHDENDIIVGHDSISENMGDFTEYDIESLIHVDNPMLWSPESPALYKLTCRLSCEGKEIDRRTINIGIRSIKFSHKGMTINGKTDKFKGVC
ncbi:MAG: beta galactosidase jelly roll domain-containing protein, partial [Muribaculaceae bacterium]|nr:beta galactosidase jelly roll domain-containing protein [Muribaculaceae bacterium]